MNYDIIDFESLNINNYITTRLGRFERFWAIRPDWESPAPSTPPSASALQNSRPYNSGNRVSADRLKRTASVLSTKTLRPRSAARTPPTLASGRRAPGSTTMRTTSLPVSLAYSAPIFGNSGSISRTCSWRNTSHVCGSSSCSE